LFALDEIRPEKRGELDRLSGILQGLFSEGLKPTGGAAGQRAKPKQNTKHKTQWQTKSKFS
jgi:hypothetical protein